MSKQSDEDLAVVVGRAEAAMKALEPALSRYKRIIGSDNYEVGYFMLSSKSCLQMLISQINTRIKSQANAKTVAGLDKPEPVAKLSRRGA